MKIRTMLSGATAVGLLASFGVLASAAAQAEMSLPSNPTTNSSLFVTVFDITNSESFTTNLGLFYNSFVNNTVSPGTILPGAYTPRSYDLDMAIFGDNTKSNLRFNVYAGDSAGGNGSKGQIITAVAAPNLQNGQMNGVNTLATAHVTVFNTNCPKDTGCAGNFGNESLWGERINGQFPVGSAGKFDQKLAFYSITGANTLSSTALTTTTAFADVNGAWTWMLTEAGRLTFSGPDVAPIPLPAAAWLLISGLIGVGALGRRSNQKA